MTHLHLHAALICSLFAATTVACAGGTTATGQAPAPTAQQDRDARLLSDAVLVLPVHEVTLEAGSGPVRPDSLEALRAAFDAELRRVLERHVAAGWMWADDVRTLHRRNPLNVPDPTRLATRDLRGARLAPEQIVGADLGSQLRALLAVAGARRYVLLPLRLHAGPASHGGYAGGLTLLVIDSRRSMIVQVRPVALRSGAGEPASAAGVPLHDVVRRLAELARLELTGPDPQ